MKVQPFREYLYLGDPGGAIRDMMVGGMYMKAKATTAKRIVEWYVSYERMRDATGRSAVIKGV